MIAIIGRTQKFISRASYAATANINSYYYICCRRRHIQAAVFCPSSWRFLNLESTQAAGDDLFNKLIHSLCGLLV